MKKLKPLLIIDAVLALALAGGILWWTGSRAPSPYPAAWRDITPPGDDIRHFTELAMLPNGDLLALRPGILYRRPKEGPWSVVKEGEVRHVAVGGPEGNTLFIASGSQVQRLEPDGATWTPCAALPKDLSATHLTWGQDRLYIVGLHGKIFVSADLGSTWDDISAATSANFDFYAIIPDPKRPNALYLNIRPASRLTHSLAETEQATGKRSVNLLCSQSLDGGATWKNLPHAPDDDIVLPTGVTGSSAPGRYLYAATLARIPGVAIARSQDGGVTWEAFDNQPDMGSVSTVISDPMFPETVYTGNWQGQVFTSTDAAKTWRRFGGALAGGFVHAILPCHQSADAVFVASGNRIYKGKAIAPK